MINNFEYYLRKGEIRKTRKDKQRALSLFKIAMKRMEELKRVESFAIKLELLYEAILEITEALLSIDGYKSYSHTAAISYLRTLGISENIIDKLDILRSKRHKSKYYGIEIDANEFRVLFEFGKEIFMELKEILKKKMQRCDA